jgi:hypothetical protein
MPNKGTLTLTSGLVAARMAHDGWIDAGTTDMLSGIEFALESVRVDIGPNDRQRAPVMLSLSCSQGTLMRLARESLRALGAYEILRTLDGSDGLPPLTYADAWIADACQRLAALAHEHDDMRLLELRATLADINRRGTVVPREAVSDDG